MWLIAWPVGWVAQLVGRWRRRLGVPRLQPIWRSRFSDRAMRTKGMARMRSTLTLSVFLGTASVAFAQVQQGLQQGLQQGVQQGLQ